MRNIILKLSAVVLLGLLAQACAEEEIVPRDTTTTDAVATAENGRVNVRNSFYSVVRTWSLEFPYAEISLEGKEVGKTLTVNWGDGTVEQHTFTEGYAGKAALYLEHYYTSVGDFTVSMTGDLDNIITVSNPFTSLDVLSMNFDKLSNLENIDMPYNSLEILDLSKNRRLKSVYGPSSTLAKSVILPNTHSISFMSSGSPNLSTEVVSAMIASIYKNAVNKKIYNGHFSLASGMEENPTFPGPPTAEDMAKLIELRDVYGWTIFPNP